MRHLANLVGRETQYELQQDERTFAEQTTTRTVSSNYYFKNSVCGYLGIICRNEKLIMADVHDIVTRSYNMSRIKGSDTKPEIIVRKFLHAKGMRYRLHARQLPGKPDLTFKKYNTTVFVNGCFWHGHENCKYFSLPKTRTEWWRKKIEATKKRDQQVRTELKIMGWNTLTVWECELKPDKRDLTLNKIYNSITGKQKETNE